MAKWTDKTKFCQLTTLLKGDWTSFTDAPLRRVNLVMYICAVVSLKKLLRSVEIEERLQISLLNARQGIHRTALDGYSETGPYGISVH